MKAICSLRIKNQSVFFGPGTRELLEKIDKTSSLRQATAEMNLSYTKALRMLRDMRKELGFEVVYSEKGGHARGKTILTEKGRQVLEAYIKVEKKVACYAQELIDAEPAFLQEVKG